MISQRSIEISVGLFLLAAILALSLLAFRVSGLTGIIPHESYEVSAAFDDIGQLKVRSAVRIDGVKVGEVTDVRLDSKSFRAIVTMRIYSRFENIPDDSSAAILTSGLLGDNYIAISPMYSETYLKKGSRIEDTHSAMILEKLIGQFIFNIKNPAKNSAEGDKQ